MPHRKLKTVLIPGPWPGASIRIRSDRLDGLERFQKPNFRRPNPRPTNAFAANWVRFVNFAFRRASAFATAQHPHRRTAIEDF